MSSKSILANIKKKSTGPPDTEADIKKGKPVAKADLLANIKKKVAVPAEIQAILDYRPSQAASIAREEKEEARGPYVEEDEEVEVKPLRAAGAAVSKVAKQRFPLMKLKDEKFSEFFVNIIKDAKMKMNKIRAGQQEKDKLQNQIAKVSSILNSIKDDELVKLRKDYYNLDARIKELSVNSDKKNKEAQKEYSKAIEDLEIERKAKILELSIDIEEEEVDEEDEAVLQVGQDLQNTRVDEEYSKKKSELENVLADKNIEYKLETASKFEDLKRKMHNMRIDLVDKIFNRLISSNKEFAQAVSDLAHRTLAYPRSSKPKEISQKEIDFIKSISSIQNRLSAKKEVLSLSAPPPSIEIPKDFIQKAISSMRPGISSKSLEKMLEEPDQDQASYRRERRGQRGSDDEDAEYSESDFVREFVEDADEEAEVEEAEQDALEDEAEIKPMGEDEMKIVFKDVSAPLGYLEEDESDKEEVEEDSEDEEEPMQKELEVIRREPVVAKVEHRAVPLTKGEKLLENLPILQISESRYQEVYAEIKLLRREIDYVYALYRDLETNIVIPFIKAVNLDESVKLALFQNTYNGKPIVPGSMIASFTMTDEQKFIAKSLLDDKKFTNEVLEILNEPGMTINDDDRITSIPDLVGNLDKERWTLMYYEKYKKFFPRIFGRAKADIHTLGLEMADIVKFLSVEQDLLLRHHLDNISPKELEEFETKSGEEKERFLSLPIGQKVLFGITALPEISISLSNRFSEIKKKLNEMVLSAVENRVDYPFITSFDQIAEYVPSLLTRVLIKNRSQISDTRQVFLRKFLLSRLTVDQYVYVKVFMGNPDTKDVFEKIISNLRTAHFMTKRVENLGLKELDTILDPDLKQLVIDIYDYSTSQSISKLFTKKSTIAEYEKQFRAKIPNAALLPKSEYTFLNDCRYAFRSEYALTFPIIGSIDDMKVVESLFPELLKDADKLSSLRNVLAEKNIDIVDSNSSYQEDLIKAMLESFFRELISKEMKKIALSMSKGFITKKAALEYFGSYPNPDEIKELPAKDVRLAIEELDKKLDVSLGSARVDILLDIHRYFGSELGRFMVYVEKLKYKLELSEALSSIIERPKDEALSAVKHMKRKLKKTRARVDSSFQSFSAADRKAAAEKKDDEDKVEAKRDIEEESIILKKSEAITKRLYKLLDKKSPTKNEIEEIMSSPFRCVMSLLDEGNVKNSILPIEYFIKEYTDKTSIIKNSFKKAPSRKTSRAVDEARQKEEKREEEELEIRKRHSELSSPSIQYVNAKYINIDQAKEAYRWEDKGVLRVHPELMSVMPRFAVNPSITPFEFCGVPLKNGWVRPSIFFFHSLANSDVEILETGIQVDGKMVQLSMVKGDEISPATASDYASLLHAVDLKSVMDAFNHSELVVIASQIDRQMVFPVSSTSFFYPGYEKVIKKISSKEELRRRIDNLLLLKARLPSQQEKIDMRIKQLQESDISIEPRSNYDELEKAYRIRLVSSELELEQIPIRIKELEDKIEQAELIGDSPRREQAELEKEKKRLSKLLEKISSIRKDYIKILQASKINKEDVDKRIAELQFELKNAPIDKDIIEKRIKLTEYILKYKMIPQPYRERVKNVDKEIEKIRERILEESKKDNPILEEEVKAMNELLETRKTYILDSISKEFVEDEEVVSDEEDEEVEDNIAELREMSSRWGVIRRDELEIVDRELDELLKLKNIQKERFVRQNEISRLNTRRQLLAQGWMRPTINLIREMNRTGRVVENDIVSDAVDKKHSLVRVGPIRYYCAIIKNGRIVPVPGEQIIQELRQYFSKRTSERYSILESFIPKEIEEDESDQKYEGTRDMVCVNCKKSIKKPWRNTVQLIKGEPRIAPLCSERCSEEYHPEK